MSGLPLQAVFHGNIDPNMKSVLQYMWEEIAQALNSVVSSGVALEDTRASRITNYSAASYTLGQTFLETDTKLIYVVRDLGSGYVWVYLTGTMRGTLSPNTKPTGLGVNDTNLVFFSTDFDRPYRWTGTVWVDGDGAPQRDVVHMCRTAPAGNGWHLCDGSANIVISKADGTTTTITVPALNNNTFVRGAAAYSGSAATAAVAPTTVAHHHSVVVPDQNSADENAHTHSVSITNNANAVLSGANDLAAAQTVTSAGGSAHHHDVPSQTFNSADFTTVVNADGLPKLMDFLPYIRL